ncbi:alpha/beta hydrolase [Magnetospirillum sp. UT-4]|uniref:alpha/beta hydrolase n=1 Tax=Magnetospirillum sp. UT-4 TaxID=2681467 RepID=UPI0013805ABA|nr:alpha/beta hydrolase [Magnetospirillum sp. UT-4]CAA7615250.1 conserved exported hypothetical protein [Magnetospirillum sp. UT-4]
MIRLFAASLALALAACAGTVVADAERAGLVPVMVETPTFRLAAWQRLPPVPGGELAVYLEGDGFAWAGRGQPSRDPTPRDPVGLAMAARDPAPAVLYLARPCQFSGRADPRCHERYWTGARLAPEVVEAAEAAVAAAMQRTGAARLRLVGYSGGGALAALLAARRSPESTRLVTVAAPLDLEAWTGLHTVSPLSASLSPADHRDRLRAVPQLHLAGAEDAVVPPSLARDWVAGLGGSCAALRVVPGFGHQCCWATLAPDQLKAPDCR